MCVAVFLSKASHGWWQLVNICIVKTTRCRDTLKVTVVIIYKCMFYIMTLWCRQNGQSQQDSFIFPLRSLCICHLSWPKITWNLSAMENVHVLFHRLSINSSSAEDMLPKYTHCLLVYKPDTRVQYHKGLESQSVPTIMLCSLVSMKVEYSCIGGHPNIWALLLNWFNFYPGMDK